MAGDDRAARDLAADLKQFLAPRQVRFYPARGMRYESHLAPPPHLVGLRIAALDALLGERPAVLVTSAVALAEKVPDPELRPHGFEIEKGGLLDLDETADQLVACGYERVEQVEERGQFAIRGDILDVYPATEERAVRCELFDVEVERLTWFSTFTQRSLEEAERVEIAPAAELAPEHRELAEIAAASDEDERPDVADVLPVDRFRELLDLVPDDALVAIAAEEELAPALRDYWEDVTTSFHDEDAHHLYVKPEALDGALDERAQLRLSSISQDQPHEFRAQAADTAARSLRDAEPELEKLVRSGYRTFVAWARRGEAERAQLNLARMQPAFLDGQARSRGRLAHVRPRQPARRLHRARAEARGAARAPPAAPPPRRAPQRARRRDRLVHRPARRLAGGPRGPRHRPVHRLRDEDRGRRDARLPRARVPRRRPRLRAERPAPQDQPLRGRRRRRPAALEARRQAVGADEAEGAPRRPGARRRADQPLRRAQAARRPRLPAPTASGSSSSRRRFPYRETPDQLEAIEAVRADMEEARPMDRLICGDVGYGKTEVALRAAFKAAEDGKQVMFLVPTTVLAQQHFGTFAERLRDYPFTIEMVSRFRSPTDGARVAQRTSRRARSTS